MLVTKVHRWCGWKEEGLDKVGSQQDVDVGGRGNGRNVAMPSDESIYCDVAWVSKYFQIEMLATGQRMFIHARGRFIHSERLYKRQELVVRLGC
jgi:hypothetical protein